jgi:hypothetical protein
MHPLTSPGGVTTDSFITGIMRDLWYPAALWEKLGQHQVQFSGFAQVGISHRHLVFLHSTPLQDRPAPGFVPYGSICLRDVQEESTVIPSLEPVDTCRTSGWK